MSSNSEFYLKTCATTSQPIFYVLIAVSGTLEEGFELRKNMDYRPFGNDGPGRVNATFLGKALVRGYKSYLDIKDPTWREYKPGGDALKTVNPAVVPTGCDEHANRYAIYAIDSRQAIIALAGEPRFLSIAPDMGLVDLRAADDLTFPDIKKLSHAFSLTVTKKPDHDRIAFMTVTSTWMKSTFVANGVIRKDMNGIITDYPESVGIWSASILNKNGTHQSYPEGCGSNPKGGQVTNVVTAMDYKRCIDAAIRLQEFEHTLDEDSSLVGDNEKNECCASGCNKRFNCQSPARYGTDKNTARFNKVMSACELEDLMAKAGVTNDSGGPKFPLQGCSLGF